MKEGSREEVDGSPLAESEISCSEPTPAPEEFEGMHCSGGSPASTATEDACTNAHSSRMADDRQQPCVRAQSASVTGSLLMQGTGSYPKRV